MELVNSRRAASDTSRMAQKIWPRLDKRPTLKLQRNRLSTVIGVITGHGIIGSHARRIFYGHLANDFSSLCKDKEDDETILHLLSTCPALGGRRKSAYYLDDLDKLACMDIGSK